MAAQSNSKSVLETKDREELVQIASAIGVKTSARASKATLITAILDSTPGGSSNGDGARRESGADGNSASGANGPSRAVRSRRTVASPEALETDFEEFVREVTTDTETSSAPASSGPTTDPAPAPAAAPSTDTPSGQGRNERQPRDFNNNAGASGAGGGAVCGRS